MSKQPVNNQWLDVPRKNRKQPVKQPVDKEKPLFMWSCLLFLAQRRGHLEPQAVIFLSRQKPSALYFSHFDGKKPPDGLIFCPFAVSRQKIPVGDNVRRHSARESAAIFFHSMKSAPLCPSASLWPLILPFSPIDGEKPPERQQLRRLSCRDCFLSVSVWFVGVKRRHLENTITNGYIIQ